MSSTKNDTYEKNFAVLEAITDSLNRDEVGIDDLLGKTREALEAARKCMEILNHQKGEFQKLETEFARLIDESNSADEGSGDEKGEGPGDQNPVQ